MCTNSIHTYALISYKRIFFVFTNNIHTSMVQSNIVNVRLSDEQIQKIDSLISKGYYKTRSDFVKNSIETRFAEDKTIERLRAILLDYIQTEDFKNELKNILDSM